MLQWSKEIKKMANKILSILNQIDVLNERSQTLEVSNLPQGRFIKEYKFLHDSVEYLIQCRDSESYYEYDIDTYIELASLLEDIYANDYIRRNGYGR